MNARFNDDEFAKLKKILMIYEWGQRTLLTKLEIIQEDQRLHQNNSPIEHIMHRIKTPESIARKLHALKKGVTAKCAREHLRDIAGIRIICPFARDIAIMVDILRAMPETHITQEKDYVTNPKPSGYRGYHVIMEVPVFYSGHTEDVAVEVQIRTEAMNFWATLEHNARYKFDKDIPERLRNSLVACAEQTAELDAKMFSIHDEIRRGDY